MWRRATCLRAVSTWCERGGAGYGRRRTARRCNAMFEAMADEGEAPQVRRRPPSAATPTRYRSRTRSFDRIIAAEVMEHLPDDTVAMAELTCVLKPGGIIAVSVPRWLPRRSAGRCRISTTKLRVAMSASIAVTSSKIGSPGRFDAHRRTPCARTSRPLLVAQMCGGSRER